MAIGNDERLRRAVSAIAQPLTGAPTDFDRVLERIGDASCVLIGEASHGTHEFYRLRALLTRRLIEEKGFAAVSAEADWPDAYRVNRYVHGGGGDGDAVESLADFKRFPAWMWRNADVLDFVGWLRAHNEGLPAAAQVGFYGLDLYSLHGSIAAVLEYLDREDPEAARRARDRYACFEDIAEEPQRYGYAVAFGFSEGCEDAVVRQLVELQRSRDERLRKDGLVAADEFFHAEQNARVVANAERYYRSMFGGRVSSWNLRDQHMADTFAALRVRLGERRGEPAKLVVWAHNSHVGDARASEVGAAGEHTLGQLVRQRHPADTVLIGFTTHTGTVTAASDWGGPAERMRVRPSLPGSYERLFHELGLPGFYLDLRDLGEAAGGLVEPRLHRAIGVIYHPRTERMSHYFETRLPQQYDAVFHLDQTRALEPLERTARWDRAEAPETYPSGV
ncbi:erythromycin esterase family protein [Nannocystis pusilla]|uniref:Erythromycin esterase family protein n=1 Tax=Nannocystis pusilla TaxID=889268 RepID=A0ABS7TJL7_9BACT|nr:erythromycin esterase family protein [Nannocystis pusilla]MBZ5708378.1 erythromycin esterase family protein [Nannocystis pusilla]